MEINVKFGDFVSNEEKAVVRNIISRVRIPDFLFKKPCTDESHNPPELISLPIGSVYCHKCPACGIVKNINF